MMKSMAVCTMSLALVGCDHWARWSVSRPIPVSLSQRCIIEALERETVVTKPEIMPTKGYIYFGLDVPTSVKTSDPINRPVGVYAYERKNDQGVLQIEFEAVRFGPNGPAEFQTYVEKTLAEVRDRVVQRCGQ